VILAGGSTALALTLPGQGHGVADPARQAAEQAAASARTSASPAVSPSPTASVAMPAAKKRAVAKHTAASPGTPQPGTGTTAVSVSQPPSAASSTRAPAPPPATATEAAKPSTGVVPSVVSETLDDAASALKAIGFDNIPWLNGCYGSSGVGDVVTQSPAAGARIALTAPVQLYLQANNCVTMPNVVGFSLASAESTLEALGFAPNEITWRAECYAGAHPADQVQTQSPAPGASVPKTQLIALGVEADNCT
jgi:serine/threonine-protein kinase